MAQRAKKRLGQHFLHDPAVIARIVETVAPAPRDRIIEIGPGKGALTRPLLERLDALHVIEVDPDLAAELRQTTSASRLIVHHADALEFDYSALATGERSLRVVGNLPYNISTPLLFHLLKHRDVILDMQLMLQREVVQRMVAKPGSKSYGRLTVMLALKTRIERCFDIGPGAFRPAPKVWSSFIRMTPYDSSPFVIRDEALLGRLVTQAFSMRRKRLSNSLRSMLDAAEIRGLGIDPGLRPEQVTPQQFVALANLRAADDTG